MPKTLKKEAEKSRLLNSLRGLLSEIEYSTRKLMDTLELLWAISQVAKYIRWSSENSPVHEWQKLLERNELVFLSSIRPKTAELKDFKESLYGKIGQSETNNLPPQELERLWERRSKFFIDETDNIENLRPIVIKRDRHRCRYCNAKEPKNQPLHLHHVIPKQKYSGANTTYNLVAACSSCNLRIGQDIEFPSDWELKEA